MRTTPLLQSQMSVAIRWIAYPEMTQYNLPTCIAFHKRIGVKRIKEAVERVIAVRDIFRLRLDKTEDGRIIQFIDPDLNIGVTELRMAEADARNYIEKCFVRPFTPFAVEPLVRFEIVETESFNYLLVDFHHVLADGASYAPIWSIKDLSASFRGEALIPDSFSMLDYAIEEQNVLKSDVYKRAKQYYKEKFHDISLTDIANKRKSAWGNQIVASEYISISEVEKWCKSHDVASSLLFMAAYGVVLSRFCGEEKVAFCTLNHGRTDRRLRNIYGMFVRNSPVLADVNPKKNIIDFVREQRFELISTIRNAAYPITHFCQDMNTIVTTVFAFQGKEMQEYVVVDNERINAMQLPHGMTEENLSCMVYAAGEEFEIRLSASDSIFSLYFLRSFVKALLVCVRNIMQSPMATIGELQIIDETERLKLLRLGEGRKTDCNETETFIDMFDRQASLTPDNIAVVAEDGCLTYSELEALSRDYANHVNHSCFIPIETYRTTSYLVQAIGIMRAGSAFVPLDINLPSGRRDYIINDIAKLSDSPLNISYMIYTSGSTGEPKGVMISHRALTNFINFIVSEWHLSEMSRISCHSTLSFDASIEDLFPVLTVGGTLYIVPEDVRMNLHLLNDYIRKNDITGGCYSTQFGQLLLQNFPDLPVDYLVVGGERMTINPPCNTRLINTYGPTEFTVDSTYYELEKNKQYENIPIGKPVDNTTAYILDAQGNMLPQGAVGELCLQGVQMAENLSECLPIYHTGDLCRWNDEGLLEFICRKDEQVKLRGFRVELAEIELAAMKTKGIEQAVAAIKEINGNEYLVLFYIGNSKRTKREINAELGLPYYMQPDFFVKLDEIPLTSNGKINRNALPCGKDLISLCQTKKGLLPRTEIECRICQLFADILGVESVYADDDFFSSGGTSILAIKLVLLAQKQGIIFTYKQFFDNPTPQGLAAILDGSRKTVENIDIADYDYSVINKQLVDLKVNNCSQNNGIENSPSSVYLLFGATGFLGIHVLNQLLQDYQGIVYCAVRADNDLLAFERLTSIYCHYHNETLDSKRVKALAVDVTDKESFLKLHDFCPSVVINCAANVRHFAHGSEIEDANYYGILNIIDYCTQHKCPLLHASTLSIGGKMRSEDNSEAGKIRVTNNYGSNSNKGYKGKDIEFSEFNLFVGQDCSENKYVLSKFMAERAVLQAVADGLEAKIVRLGNLTPRASDTCFQMNSESNTFMRTFRGFAKAGIYPKEISNIPVHLEPVDDSARAMLMFAHAQSNSIILHCSNDNYITYGDCIMAMKNAGISLNALSINDFLKEIDTLDEETRTLLLTNVIAYGINAESFSRRIKINSEHSKRMLANLGFEWSGVGESYLTKLFLPFA